MTLYELWIGDVHVTVGPSWCVTRFSDGTEVHAHPSEDDGTQEARALSLGYPTVAAMTREHDLVHSMLAHAQGLPHSPTLWGVAHEDPAPDDVVEEEERTVLFIQRVMNTPIGVMVDEFNKDRN